MAEADSSNRTQDPSMRRVESSVSQFSERPEDGDGEVKETW
jgi:hypothetical protein